MGEFLGEMLDVLKDENSLRKNLKGANEVWWIDFLGGELPWGGEVVKESGVGGKCKRVGGELAEESGVGGKVAYEIGVGEEFKRVCGKVV